MAGFRAHSIGGGDPPHVFRGTDDTVSRSWTDSGVALGSDGTHFGYVHSGTAQLRTSAGTFRLSQGMYFCAPAQSEISGGSGFIATHLGHRGVFIMGGPVEQQGRLRYIDGCTDSLLIGPTVLGDPCLNHLHIPAGTAQTRHTHPSIRVGIIARGSGRCVTPEREHSLSPGLLFIIEANCPHSFHTDDSSLDVVVYHPDSDHGPTHHDHPMINKTIIGTSE